MYRIFPRVIICLQKKRDLKSNNYNLNLEIKISFQIFVTAVNGPLLRIT